jgi:hypothetical protein
VPLLGHFEETFGAAFVLSLALFLEESPASPISNAELIGTGKTTMKTRSKPPKKKNPGREPDPSAKDRRAPAEAPAKDGSGVKSTPEPAPMPSKEEVVSNWTKPVTNQDEQDKITNAGEGDIPIAT